MRLGLFTVEQEFLRKRTLRLRYEIFAKSLDFDSSRYAKLQSFPYFSYQYINAYVIGVNVWALALVLRKIKDRPLWTLFTSWLGGGIVLETLLRLLGEYLYTRFGTTMPWVEGLVRKLFSP